MMEDLFAEARQLDREDGLRSFRNRFLIPALGPDREQAYFCGHSLGLQPKAAAEALSDVMTAWREQAVAGHFRGEPAWIDFHRPLALRLAQLVGAKPPEVAVMNTLTVNLHLMMVSFFRPEGRRCKILIEQHAFPSDRYAVASQLRFHNLDPAECLVELDSGPDGGEIDESAIEHWLERYGDEVALVLWPGVQYISGQRFDIERITEAAHAAGARVGFDLAHAAGNVPLALHEAGCDFAVWCHYKYLNSGPGAIGGCFVHGRHHGTEELKRFEGWWGNAAANRFAMEHDFTPGPGAEAWVLSNPPILSMAPIRASLDLFEEAGMDRLRAKSVAMGTWLLRQIDDRLAGLLQVITPADPERRGCQLSLRVRPGRKAGRRLFEYLGQEGVICDWREPDVIRIAPVPLYNHYEDCARFLACASSWRDF
jgi:kynureninase